MTILEILHSLPNQIKEQISHEYGSIDGFYQMVFKLNATDYNLFITKPIGYENAMRKIQNQIEEIEDKLERLGVIDGSYITSEISNDHGEIVVNQNIKQLDNYLRQSGTNYNTMRKWLSDNYGI